MSLPTEPIGSIPRAPALLAAWRDYADGRLTLEGVASAERAAVLDTLRRFEATGSRVITDGEQTKPDFATYAVHGLPTLAYDGVLIHYADGHTRQLPRLTAGPFRYAHDASTYLAAARSLTKTAMKQSVVSASMLSLLYPEGGLDGYAREAFLDDLVNESEREIRACLSLGARSVQIDFSEARLAAKHDPSLALLRDFVALNNRVLDRFNADERTRIGVHACAGHDHGAAHSADVDPAAIIPELCRLEAGTLYVPLAGERDRAAILRSLKAHARPEQRIFVGVIDPRDPRVETADEVCDRALEAAEFITAEQLGTTDDCGFAPYYDDQTTSRETAFAKIRARVQGTTIAEKKLGLA